MYLILDPHTMGLRAQTTMRDPSLCRVRKRLGRKPFITSIGDRTCHPVT